MIKINLLLVEPKNKVQKAQTSQTSPGMGVQVSTEGMGQLLLGLFVICLGVGICVAVNYFYSSKVDKVRSSVETVNKEIKKLKVVEEQLKEFEKNNAEVKSKIQALNNLEKDREGSLYLMRFLPSVIPSRLWLRNFNYRGKRVELLGISRDEREVADFVRKLEGSGYFKDVKIKLINLENIQDINRSFRKFNITSRFEFTTDNKDTTAKEMKGGK